MDIQHTDGKKMFLITKTVRLTATKLDEIAWDHNLNCSHQYGNDWQKWAWLVDDY